MVEFEDLEPTLAIVLRADEPVPAEIVRDLRRTPLVQRLFIAFAIVIIILMLAIVFHHAQSADETAGRESKALLTLTTQVSKLEGDLRTATSERQSLENQVNALKVEISKLLRILKAHGITPPATAVRIIEPSPAASGTSPQPSPTPAPKPSSSPTPKPSPSRTSSPTPNPTATVCQVVPHVCKQQHDRRRA